MGKYVEYKKTRQEEFNALPIFWALNDSQLEKELSKRGLTLNDTDKIMRIGNHLCYFLSKDLPIVKEYFNRDRDKELRDRISNSKSFALDAFKYEMRNHEYAINEQGDWDVCSVFGDVEYAYDKSGEDYLKELGFADHVIAIWQQARKAVIAYDF